MPRKREIAREEELREPASFAGADGRQRASRDLDVGNAEHRIGAGVSPKGPALARGKKGERSCARSRNEPKNGRSLRPAEF